MRVFIFISLFFISVLSFGQSQSERLNAIRATVERVQNDRRIIADTIENNRRIIEQLQSGVHCRQINEVPYSIKITFDDEAVQDILPVSERIFLSSGFETMSVYDITFIEDQCFRQQNQRCLLQEQRIMTRITHGNFLIETDGRQYSIQNVEQQSAGTACDMERFKDQI